MSGLAPLTALARLDGLTGPHGPPSRVVSVRGAAPGDLQVTMRQLIGADRPL